jgi:PHD/YefM family antitoxin component YafN of YafNO toxin-antitoxin module
MAETVRRAGVKRLPLSVVRDKLGRFLHDAERQEILIMRRGRPAGVLIGFASEEDWFDYQLQTDPRFERGIEAARQSLRAGQGVKLEDIDAEK